MMAEGAALFILTTLLHNSLTVTSSLNLQHVNYGNKNKQPSADDIRNLQSDNDKSGFMTLPDRGALSCEPGDLRPHPSLCGFYLRCPSSGGRYEVHRCTYRPVNHPLRAICSRTRHSCQLRTHLRGYLHRKQPLSRSRRETETERETGDSDPENISGSGDVIEVEADFNDNSNDTKNQDSATSEILREIEPTLTVTKPPLTTTRAKIHDLQPTETAITKPLLEKEYSELHGNKLNSIEILATLAEPDDILSTVGNILPDLKVLPTTAEVLPTLGDISSSLVRENSTLGDVLPASRDIFPISGDDLTTSHEEISASDVDNTTVQAESHTFSPTLEAILTSEDVKPSLEAVLPTSEENIAISNENITGDNITKVDPLQNNESNITTSLENITESSSIMNMMNDTDSDLPPNEGVALDTNATVLEKITSTLAKVITTTTEAITTAKTTATKHITTEATTEGLTTALAVEIPSEGKTPQPPYVIITEPPEEGTTVIDPTELVETVKSANVGAIVGIVIGIILVGVLIAVIVILVKKKKLKIPETVSIKRKKIVTKMENPQYGSGPGHAYRFSRDSALDIGGRGPVNLTKFNNPNLADTPIPRVLEDNESPATKRRNSLPRSIASRRDKRKAPAPPNPFGDDAEADNQLYEKMSQGSADVELATFAVKNENVASEPSDEPSYPLLKKKEKTSSLENGKVKKQTKPAENDKENTEDEQTEADDNANKPESSLLPKDKEKSTSQDQLSVDFTLDEYDMTKNPFFAKS